MLKAFIYAHKVLNIISPSPSITCINKEKLENVAHNQQTFTESKYITRILFLIKMVEQSENRYDLTLVDFGQYLVKIYGTMDFGQMSRVQLSYPAFPSLV